MIFISNLLSSNIKGLINEQYMDFRQNIKIYQPQIPNIFPKSQIILPPKSQIPKFLTPQIPNTITPPPPPTSRHTLTMCVFSVSYRFRPPPPFQ